MLKWNCVFQVHVFGRKNPVVAQMKVVMLRTVVTIQVNFYTTCLWKYSLIFSSPEPLGS